MEVNLGLHKFEVSLDLKGSRSSVKAKESLCGPPGMEGGATVTPKRDAEDVCRGKVIPSGRALQGLPGIPGPPENAEKPVRDSLEDWREF